ncbi:hypothetical protein ACFVL4_13635 [Bacillus subtilis]|uniref:Uncharacterized protein n=1 Tax=Bacillus subtilis TaxID=1423 RepID=A4ZYV7_BACIU|nr:MULTISPECIES: hypothetical protein [Bacillus]ABP52077.1 hypothetical protein [Bacillus subtilis]APB62292.1 hypothetical protein pBS72_0230 [Bacillus subtilis]KIN41267.1 hypothetical protein B4071_4344 [Bacillus subtilis]MEC2297460.1 hypothetical protein [Bacillus subtilis]MEC3664927.1 hypothetical protein [Bacillus subtilis]
MGELKGLCISVLIFAVLFVPSMLNIWINHFQSSQLLNVSTEVQKLVAEEGGVTSPVKEVQNKLGKQGATVKFLDKNGNNIDGKQKVGTQINIYYSLTYPGMYKQNTINTANSVIVNRR